MPIKKYLTFIGPIAAGKGTQAERISHKYGFLHISTGHIFRDEMKNNTELGNKIRNIMDNGFLVPDEITNNIVRDLLGRIDLAKGFIFDGYPRTLNQAEVLDEMLASRRIALDAVIKIEISEAEIIRRLSGRFTCVKCGQNYHDTDMRPKTDGVCDMCGGREFVRRADDKPEVIKNRLKIYHAEIDPIVEFYRKKGLIFEIDGTTLGADNVTKRIEEIIESA
ncbi:MAG: adenylate kinase [Rickettsiales bacterium]|nr:adenylate kinase [Rickettsiales bacterium]